jgi:parallel beta-helix repeat protein
MSASKAALAALPLALVAALVALPSSTPQSAPSTVQAASTSPALYVSRGGSDSNPGTRARPFRQINRAAALATPGTVVHVGLGGYDAVTTERSGRAGAPITYVSDGKWGAVINAQHATSAWTNTGQYVTIRNFQIVNSAYNGILTTASNGTFVGNHIHHLVPPGCSRGGGGIVAENYSAVNNDIIGNEIDHITAPGDCALIHGIYLQSPHGGRILNNVVYETSGWGIHLWHNANHILISNNTVFHNRQGGMVIGGSLEGNDLAPGIASGNTISNNIVMANPNWGIREMGRVGRNTYTDNLLYRNGTGDFSLSGGGRPTGTVTGNPMFVRYAPRGGGDYRLRPHSAAFNRGTMVGALGYDFRNRLRPQAGRADIGAFER